jgi:hypothetical protein
MRAAGFWPVAIYPPGVNLKGRTTTGKEPIGKAWGLERWDEARLTSAFEKYPAAGVGICFGPDRAPGGGWLIDLEGDGPNAGESLNVLVGDCLETPGWTSRRGGHNIFEADGERLLDALASAGAKEGSGSNSGVWHLPELPDLEFRAGGYKRDNTVKQVQSVIPPTAGEDGKPRVWNGINVISKLPESAYARLNDIATKKRPLEPSEASSGNSSPVGGDAKSRRRANHAAYAEAGLDDECKRIRRATEGTRNDTLNRAAFAAGQLLGAGALERGTAVGKLTAAAQAAGLPIREVNVTIESGLKAGELLPRDLSRFANRSTESAERSMKGLGRQIPRARKDDIDSDDEPIKLDFPLHSERSDPAITHGSDDGRAKIVITTLEHDVIQQAANALADAPDVFQRGNALVTILPESQPRPSKKRVRRSPGSVRISVLPPPQVRKLLTRQASWLTAYRTRDGKERLEETHPPDWAVSAVATLGYWPGVRHLNGIIETPTLRPDGSMIRTNGYDSATGLFLAPNDVFPRIPAKPTRDDARAASSVLYEIVADFPFLDETHKAAWLAALLTPLARFAIDGPCPMFVFDANNSGAGKSKLCDVIAVVATGRVMPRGDYPDNQAEMQKMLLSVVMQADRLLLFDNVPTGFSIGGSALDRALTARTMKGRILGKSEMSPELPVDVVFYATGNNLGLKADALRRVVPCRLETAEERPEERTDFTINESCECGCKGDLLEHVKRIRGRLVAAALTIIRAYIVAGRPNQGLIPMDYPAWSGLIRNAVYWATDVDPCATRREMVADDDETNANKALVENWPGLCETVEKTALTASQAIAVLDQFPERNQTVREVFLGWSKDGKLPASRTVGAKLKGLKGRNINGKAFQCKESAYREWYVKAVPAPKSSGSSGSGGSAPNTARENCADECNTRVGAGDENSSHQSHQSHHLTDPHNWSVEWRRRWGLLTNQLEDEGIRFPESKSRALEMTKVEMARQAGKA